VIDSKKPNKPLFSQHYLEHRIQECPEWLADVAEGFEALKKLYLSKKDLLPTLSEAQTEEVFIKPTLDILGFSNIPQVTTRGKGRAERPDYALFTSEADRDAAYPVQNDESAFYGRVRAIAEAKYWKRPLSKVSADDKRDIYKNTNPSFQISSYLTGTGVDWGILTNGCEWRLYYRQASSTATEFYQVDLVELLDAADLEQFKYFWLFFRQAAFIKDPQGHNFLERVREGSTTYATRVGSELKALVFDRVFPGLAGGFVTDAVRRKVQVTADQVHEATLSFLYKLLFLLYAEARNLLPIDRDYRDYSLIKMTQEVAKGVERQKSLSQTSTGMYDRLLSLFQIVDRGDAGLGVPRYNGGLFHFDFSAASDQEEYRANHFLFRFKLSDAVLAPVLDKLARFEGQPIDYSFLGVRQLGSIYEGLLEYRVVIADAAAGQVHLENDKGERKATGSYYTPDYIVKYIVSHTLKPILAGRQARFGELMAQIDQLHKQLQDKRLGDQSRNGLGKELKGLEREAQSTLLDIKVCDPAMGSGHFLVEAVDYLTDELIRILTQYPDHNPVLEMLEQTRSSILQNLEQQGITINPDRLEPTQLLQRVVMKRCIYGVDLNVMAVELAKVSLWLHSFTIGAPLSFLDHHIRCGNSLIGTTAREAEANMSQESSGQFNLLAGPFVGLLRAAEIMRGVSVLSDATFAEVEQSETLFRSFDAAAKPYKRLLDIYMSKYFGLKRAEHFLRVFETTAITADPKKMNKADAAVYDDAQKLSDEKHFFHWDLEFPEVFIDLDTASWKDNPGFDAVVGNPPYFSVDDTWGKKSIDAEYLKSSYPEIWMGKNDIFYFFFQRGVKILKNNNFLSFITSRYFLEAHFAKSLRNFLSQNTLIKEILDFGNFIVFENLGIKTCITVLQKNQNHDLEKVRFIQIAKEADTSTVEVLLEKNENLESFSEVDQINLNSDNWNLGYLKNVVAIEKIDKNCISLGDITFIGQGMQTGDNEVFLVDQRTIEKYNIEPEFVKKLIKNQDVKSYSLNFRDIYIIYPNDIDELKENYGISKYLRDNQEALRSRAAYIRGNCEWFKYTWTLHKQNYHLPKIIVPYIAPENRFALDLNAEYISLTDTTVIFPNSELELNFKFILAILNSRLLNYRYRFIAKPKDYRYEYFENTLSRIPVRNIYFTTPIEYRQQLLQIIIVIYNQFQSDRNSDPLLLQIDHHLSQQPEEADVVHDLLAHLAEQMIELNKQKQTETKSFLQWLERFIGCPIDTLTNKSKIQNYLGDYSKKETVSIEAKNDTGESHLSFDALIELLKKNKKKLKIDPDTRKEQQTLEKEFQASLETLLPLKMQLMRCDQLIDQIVYKLYGLTEEEVAIVEGKILTLNADSKEIN
jgi:Eco57I restriction-modification methylase/TaqI-like C-terminal specificity domain